MMLSDNTPNFCRPPSWPADWIIPDWPAPTGVRAVCTSRNGGVSVPPWNSLNLGSHVGDASDKVNANRACLQQALGARPVFMEQVHGLRVLELHAGEADAQQADAAITGHNGLACTVMVADCLPVLFTDTSGTRVAAAHAGWRGLAGADGIGILEQVSRLFWPLTHKDKAQDAIEVIAWLGPCIGPQAFEVGADVRRAFVETHPHAADCFKPVAADKWMADLPGLARQRLAALGMERVYGNDGSSAWCTVQNPSRFFSHRRDRISGRMAACIWRG